MGEESNSSSSARVPGYVKLVMSLQTIIILFLSFWIYNEYLSNPFLQTYVNGALPSTTIAIVSLGSIGFFSALAIVLVKKLRTAQKELGVVLSDETVRNVVTKKPGFLDQQTEHHLVELIRRSNAQSNTATETVPLPVLKRVDEEKSGSGKS